MLDVSSFEGFLVDTLFCPVCPQSISAMALRHQAESAQKAAQGHILLVVRKSSRYIPREWIRTTPCSPSFSPCRSIRPAEAMGVDLIALHMLITRYTL